MKVEQISEQFIKDRQRYADLFVLKYKCEKALQEADAEAGEILIEQLLPDRLSEIQICAKDFQHVSEVFQGIVTFNPNKYIGYSNSVEGSFLITIDGHVYKVFALLPKGEKHED